MPETDARPAPSAEGRRLVDDILQAAWRVGYREGYDADEESVDAAAAGQLSADAALSAYVAGLEAKAARLREAVEDMVWQFAYPGMKDGRLVLSTGGLSALEGAFDALGWPDPKPCPERECEAQGCHREATTGTPTADGYKRLCGDHFRTLGTRAAALVHLGTEP